MPQQETGKQRAIRIPLDYFRKGDTLGHWKRLFGFAALIAAVAWLVAAYLLPSLFPGRFPAADMLYARGPVARVHAAWEEDCQACHVPFTPIKRATMLGKWCVSSEQCKTCHKGPPHHEGQTPDLACADCHRDHQG